MTEIGRLGRKGPQSWQKRDSVAPAQARCQTAVYQNQVLA